jgi:hypothetical protein
MEKRRQDIFSFFLLFLLIFFISANLMMIFNFPEKNKITAAGTSAEASVQLSIIARGSYCGDGVCDLEEDCSTCPADCACSSGYTCQNGICVVESSSTSTSTSTSTSSSTSSGGGAAAPVAAYDFYLDKSSLKIEIQKGKFYQGQVSLKNNGNSDLEINASVIGLKKFITFERESFILRKGMTYVFKFNVYASEKELIDIYVGKINFNSEHVKRSLNIGLDIKAAEPLFDVKTTVLKKYVLPGNLIEANVSILNLGEAKNVEIELDYAIWDFENKIYDSGKEIFMINESFSKIFSFRLSNDIEMGEYVFYSRVNYKDKSASSYDSFFVERLSFFMWVLIVAFIVVLILILFMIIIWKRRKDKKEEIKSNLPKNLNTN